MMQKQIIVLLGSGSMGVEIVKRIAAGKTILLGDLSEKNLARVKADLENGGYDVVTAQVDASSRESIKAFAAKAAGLGEVTSYIHTAGVSPNQAPSSAIIGVDLIGTAIALEEFGNIIANGGAGLVISSQAGYMIPSFSEEEERFFAESEPESLAASHYLDTDHVPSSAAAYGIAKRANQLRVQYASMQWGDRGARINSVSPGIIITPLAKDELNSEAGPAYQQMIEKSAARRAGTPADVAGAAAFLLSDQASFITGADLLIDGGVVAALKNGRISL